ncbi:hypothetical protein [Prochlorothrix hollandica]|uniref:Roadblock/LAMTOR2 domain-containing protein n=1 Tax=Prochlorothrix hollandica PCC 9006 = CALU 1027 TaxID=317619 RepID=A0A0M2PY01_PROHO|nr:hypothetical protein [Prochlorothrix hollandica]KKI99261.1 hypothetical protein PROH_16130 [Prochlorothrix hollandica PCC 9006 = CALU 1027]
MTPQTADDLYQFCAQQVLGAAVFDWNGLPKEYFTTDENKDIGWVQTVFQVLGLRSLLMSSLRLEGFMHVIVEGSPHRAIIVKHRDGYVALLLDSNDHQDIAPSFLDWAHNLNTQRLSTDPRFHGA